MSFTQCRNRDELEKITDVDGYPGAFITEDHRIYTDIELADENGYIKLTPATVTALWELQTHIEILNEHCGMEMGFDTVAEKAKELQTAWDKALKAIKFKPLEKKKR